MARKKNGKVATNIYRRGDSFEVRVRMGPGEREVRTARSKDEALQIRAQLEKARRERRKGTRSDLTVAAWRDRWLQQVRDNPDREETTYLHYESQTKHFLKEFGDRKLSSFTRGEAQEYALNQPSKSRGVSAMFGAAFHQLVIDTNPFERVQTSRTSRRKDLVVLTRPELDLLLKTCERVHGEYGREYAAMVAVAAWTGMRPGELFALRWADVEETRIHVRRTRQAKTAKIVNYTKNKDQRNIVLPPPARIRLVNDVPRWDDDLVFHTKSGAPFSQRTSHYYWDPVRSAFWSQLPKDRQAVIDRDLDFYELRHFCATLMTRAKPHGMGLPAYVVARQLGHKDGGALVQQLYSHPEHEDALTAIDVGYREMFG